MTFKYQAVEPTGAKIEGTIDAPSKDLAIAALQRRKLVIVSLGEEQKPLFKRSFTLFEHVSLREVVMLSWQISTLFEAQVSAVKAFRLLSSESENVLLSKKIAQVADDVQTGVPISVALSKHSEIFSPFYVNMVKAGEESGKLNQSFSYLADYLDRQYELTSKTRNALIYPAIVISTFIIVMTLMLTLVIPTLSSILAETGQEVPIYTKIVIGISDFLVNYGLFLLVAVAAGSFYYFRIKAKETGKRYFDEVKLSVPYISDLYKNLYLSRIADNMDTMLSSGISMVVAIDITGGVVDNMVYSDILREAGETIKSGSAMSEALSRYPDQVPPVMIQMIKVGEESGELGFILKTLAKFYKREVESAIDNLVGLIEPLMIVVLGLGIGLLLVAVLIPVYNIAGGL
ncbi:type II secretion system F family protein [Candidatus Parcubacteria bacterium]|nr:type II secretion system F family protein [Candidatus Parcubacteria bacterium]